MPLRGGRRLLRWRLAPAPPPRGPPRADRTPVAAARGRDRSPRPPPCRAHRDPTRGKRPADLRQPTRAHAARRSAGQGLDRDGHFDPGGSCATARSGALRGRDRPDGSPAPPRLRKPARPRTARARTSSAAPTGDARHQGAEHHGGSCATTSCQGAPSAAAAPTLGPPGFWALQGPPDPPPPPRPWRPPPPPSPHPSTGGRPRATRPSSGRRDCDGDGVKRSSLLPKPGAGLVAGDFSRRRRHLLQLPQHRGLGPSAAGPGRQLVA